MGQGLKRKHQANITVYLLLSVKTPVLENIVSCYISAQIYVSCVSCQPLVA